jgi:hypothetical protein
VNLAGEKPEGKRRKKEVKTGGGKEPRRERDITRQRERKLSVRDRDARERAIERDSGRE